MLYRFFEDTLASRFIKHLLRSEPIPRFRMIQLNDYIVNGGCYLYNGLVIHCEKAGYFFADEFLYPSDILYPSPNTMPGVSGKGYYARYKVLKYYDKNDPTVHYNYHSKQMWHDSDTHYHLGEYLRYLRYETKLNLMPFYNCYNYKSTVNFEAPTGKKCLFVPVKFDRQYTFALNSATPFKLYSILYNQFLGRYDTDEVLMYSKKFVNATFNKPFVIKMSSANSNTSESFNERDLYIVVELDADVETGLVVLEGDYTTSDTNSSMNTPTSSVYNLSLLKVDNGVSYAFSSRLIEYLLLHVITEQDTISDNIKRVYSQLNKLSKTNITVSLNDAATELDNTSASYGAWDDSLSDMLIQYIQYLIAKGYPLIDQDGNVNSQLEEYLRKGVT